MEYYKLKDGRQVWDIIVDCDLNFFQGSIFSYLQRAGKKTVDVINDYEKSLHYLNYWKENHDKIKQTQSKEITMEENWFFLQHILKPTVTVTDICCLIDKIKTIMWSKDIK